MGARRFGELGTQMNVVAEVIHANQQAIERERGRITRQRRWKNLIGGAAELEDGDTGHDALSVISLPLAAGRLRSREIAEQSAPALPSVRSCRPGARQAASSLRTPRSGGRPSTAAASTLDFRYLPGGGRWLLYIFPAR